jgi:hypothetical protein
MQTRQAVSAVKQSVHTLLCYLSRTYVSSCNVQMLIHFDLSCYGNRGWFVKLKLVLCSSVKWDQTHDGRCYVPGHTLLCYLSLACMFKKV